MPLEIEPTLASRSASVPVALRGLAGAVAFALLAAIAAQIRLPLPFTPVPFTLQVFVVALAGYTLGAGWGGTGLLLYLALGLVGAPVFSGGTSGTAALTGFTAGYLLAYPAAALVTGLWSGPGAGRLKRIGGGVAGLVLIHLGGAVWLRFVAPQAPDSTLALLTWSLLPFVGVDLVKVLAAEWLSRRWREGWR